MVICGIGALVGLIPIKGYGSLCSERLIYPLSFLFLSILHLVIIFMIRCSIKNEELLQITNDDLKIFYENLVYSVLIIKKNLNISYFSLKFFI